MISWFHAPEWLLVPQKYASIHWLTTRLVVECWFPLLNISSCSKIEIHREFHLARVVNPICMHDLLFAPTLQVDLCNVVPTCLMWRIDDPLPRWDACRQSLIDASCLNTFFPFTSHLKMIICYLHLILGNLHNFRTHELLFPWVQPTCRFTKPPPVNHLIWSNVNASMIGVEVGKLHQC